MKNDFGKLLFAETAGLYLSGRFRQILSLLGTLSQKKALQLQCFLTIFVCGELYCALRDFNITLRHCRKIELPRRGNITVPQGTLSLSSRPAGHPAGFFSHQSEKFSFFPSSVVRKPLTIAGRVCIIKSDNIPRRGLARTGSSRRQSYESFSHRGASRRY